jgi:hypothetical protein
MALGGEAISAMQSALGVMAIQTATLACSTTLVRRGAIGYRTCTAGRRSGRPAGNRIRSTVRPNDAVIFDCSPAVLIPIRGTLMPISSC